VAQAAAAGGSPEYTPGRSPKGSLERTAPRNLHRGPPGGPAPTQTMGGPGERRVAAAARSCRQRFFSKRQSIKLSRPQAPISSAAPSESGCGRGGFLKGRAPIPTIPHDLTPPGMLSEYWRTELRTRPPYSHIERPGQIILLSFQRPLVFDGGMRPKFASPIADAQGAESAKSTVGVRATRGKITTGGARLQMYCLTSFWPNMTPLPPL